MKSGFELKVKNESRTALGAKRAELASLEFRFQAVDRYDQYPVLACGRTSCHSVFFMDCLFIWRYFGWEFHMSTGRDGRSISCIYGSRSEIFTHPSNSGIYPSDVEIHILSPIISDVICFSGTFIRIPALLTLYVPIISVLELSE